MHPTTADGAFAIALLGACGTALQAAFRFLEKRRKGDLEERRLSLEELRTIAAEQREEIDDLRAEVRGLRGDVDDAWSQVASLRRALADAHEEVRNIQREKERLMVALEAARGGRR